MKNEKQSYFAVIPANVRYDKRLKLLSRLLYGEITALCNKEGYCWANNKYFANLYDVSIQTISNAISQLKEYGYITVELIYKGGTKEIFNRYIKIFEYPIKEIFNTPIKENFKDNNTNINNTFNNTFNNIDVQIENSLNSAQKEKIDAQIEELFNEFWQKYPRKVNKKKTKDKFIHLLIKDKIDYSVISKGLDNYIKQIKDKGTATEYIAHPTTWLNGARWEDDYTFKEEEQNLSKKEFKVYGEFKNVKLTDEQIDKLKVIYGSYLEEAIEIVSSHVQSLDKKYKDFYAVLGKHNWVYKEIIKRINEKKKTQREFY